MAISKLHKKNRTDPKPATLNPEHLDTKPHINCQLWFTSCFLFVKIFFHLSNVFNVFFFSIFKLSTFSNRNILSHVTMYLPIVSPMCFSILFVKFSFFQLFSVFSFCNFSIFDFFSFFHVPFSVFVCCSMFFHVFDLFDGTESRDCTIRSAHSQFSHRAFQGQHHGS